MRVTHYHATRHLSPGQLIAAEDCCPVCGGISRRGRAGVIQREPDVELLACPDCHACSASRMPKPGVLEEYYREYFDDDAPKTTFPETARFVNNLRPVTRACLPAGHVRVLDFGGGDGTLGFAVAGALLRARPAHTAAVTLVDYQSPGPAAVNERMTVTHRRTLADVDGPFDLVLASAVLEHIPDLRPVLEQLFDLVAPGGLFYARTPYAAPLKRLLPRLDLTYPGHVHDLGAPFWNRVPDTFHRPLRIVTSRPSLIETDWRRQPARTAAAWLMKLPARLETALARRSRTPWWRLVGGWEVILQRDLTTGAPQSADASSGRLHTARALLRR